MEQSDLVFQKLKAKKGIMIWKMVIKRKATFYESI